LYGRAGRLTAKHGGCRPGQVDSSGLDLRVPSDIQSKAFDIKVDEVDMSPCGVPDTASQLYGGPQVLSLSTVTTTYGGVTTVNPATASTSGDIKYYYFYDSSFYDTSTAGAKRDANGNRMREILRSFACTEGTTTTCKTQPTCDSASWAGTEAECLASAGTCAASDGTANSETTATTCAASAGTCVVSDADSTPTADTTAAACTAPKVFTSTAVFTATKACTYTTAQSGTACNTMTDNTVPQPPLGFSASHKVCSKVVPTVDDKCVSGGPGPGTSESAIESQVFHVRANPVTFAPQVRKTPCQPLVTPYSLHTIIIAY
jgi:hypothetical protein